MSLRDDLIAAMRATASSKPRAVKTKSWGTVFVREVTVAEIDEQTSDTADGKDKNRIARGAARVICDEDGKRLFDPANEADVELLASQPWSLLRAVIRDVGDSEGN